MVVPSRYTIAFLIGFLPTFLAAAASKPDLPRHLIKKSGLNTRSVPTGSMLYWPGQRLNRITRVYRNDRLTLQCEAGGSPSPVIYWLKNGQRIDHNHPKHEGRVSFEKRPSDESMIRMSITKSRLDLGCVTKEDQGVYTCVSQTPYMRRTQSTRVKVAHPSSHFFSHLGNLGCRNRLPHKGEAARISMWTATKVEYEAGRVQLFCRATGSPRPNIMWFDRDKKPVENDNNYRITEYGDLIVRNVSWVRNKGFYTCFADNKLGSDAAEIFLYPIRRFEGF